VTEGANFAHVYILKEVIYMPKSIIISGGSVSRETTGNKRRFGNRNRRGFGNRNRRGFGNKNRRKLKFIYRLLIFMLVLAGVFLIILRYSEARLRPIMTSMAEAHARSIGARVVGEAINEQIAMSNLAYDDLISFEKAADGRVSALKTNILTVNRLKSALAVVILNKLACMEDINLYIPVGNLLNGEFLSGRGPRIEVILIPVGSVVTDISNVFTSAGINQTRHQIMLDVRVTVSIILPFSVETTDIYTSVSIAETIIVGDVPNMYMGETPNIAVSP